MREILGTRPEEMSVQRIYATRKKALLKFAKSRERRPMKMMRKVVERVLVEP